MNSNDTRTILQLVLVDETGDSYYRMRWPGRQLAEQSPGWRVINLDACAQERMLWAEQADLLVLYQSNDLDLLPLIERRRRQGKRTLVEYNDNFYEPPPASPVSRAWASPLIWQTYESFMRAADALIVTGPGLQELFTSKGFANIHVLENHLPRQPAPFEAGWREPDKELLIGWAGSLGHMSDFLAVLPVLKELLLEIPRLKLCVMGNESIPSLVNLPPERFKFKAWGSMNDYYEFWRPIQIGIVPLLDTAYNRCRSDIKAVEISALAALPLLPAALPYRHFLERTAQPPYHDWRELKERVLALSADAGVLRENAERCYRFVSQERIGAARQERLRLYQSMMPEGTNDFRWPVGPGYHELNGTTQSTPLFHETLKAAQNLLQQKNEPLAHQVLEQAWNSNPENPELALALAKVAARGQRENARRLLADCRVRFPHDLRFPLLELRLSTAGERGDAWRRLMTVLRERPQAKEFFAGEIIKNFCEQFQQDAELTDAAKELAELYPSAAALRFQLAERLERLGEFAEARRHFNWVREAYEQDRLSHQFFAGLQPEYVAVWTEALEARLKGRL